MNEQTGAEELQGQGRLDFIDEAPLRAAAQPRSVRPRRTGFGGFSWGQIAAMLALIAAAIWGIWISREMLALKERRIVAVNLSGLVNDFIMAEARSGNPPEQVERETRHFMGALNSALQARARAGETIVVGEAVVAASVPDITPEIRAGLGRAITAQGIGQGRGMGIGQDPAPGPIPSPVPGSETPGTPPASWQPLPPRLPAEERP